MRENKRIEKRLLAKGIKQYKIVRTIVKELRYREYFGKESIEDISDDKIFVLFKTGGGVAKFTISAFQSDNTIDTIIESSIKNTEIMSVPWNDDNFINVEIRKDENYNHFHNFDSNQYLMWIKQEMSEVSQSINFTFNVVYKVDMYRYCLLTNKDYLEQYNASSMLLCLENKTWKRRACLDNCFFKDDIDKSIIHQLNEVDLPRKNITINKSQSILIKAKALSKLLNAYICLYYADQVYSNQSNVRTDYIGKQIVKSEFDLIAIPYNGIKFDGEGSKISKKLIIDSGNLVNLLSNNSHSHYLNIKSYGNASFDMVDVVSHQRLIFTLKNKKKFVSQPIDLTIYHFQDVFIDFYNNEFIGIAICGDKSGRYHANIRLNVKDTFDSIYSVGTKNAWIQNVYCQDVIISR
jgi:Predicted Zn-dependent proteases and their inactivated homologs